MIGKKIGYQCIFDFISVFLLDWPDKYKKKVYIKNYDRISSAKIIASDDKKTWVDISESFSTPKNTEIYHNIIDNNKGYRYYALYPTSYAVARLCVYELQFYGREA